MHTLARCMQSLVWHSHFAPHHSCTPSSFFIRRERETARVRCSLQNGLAVLYGVEHTRSLYTPLISTQVPRKPDAHIKQSVSVKSQQQNQSTRFMCSVPRRMRRDATMTKMDQISKHEIKIGDSPNTLLVWLMMATQNRTKKIWKDVCLMEILNGESTWMEIVQTHHRQPCRTQNRPRLPDAKICVQWNRRTHFFL